MNDFHLATIDERQVSVTAHDIPHSEERLWDQSSFRSLRRRGAHVAVGRHLVWNNADAYTQSRFRGEMEAGQTDKPAVILLYKWLLKTPAPVAVTAAAAPKARHIADLIGDIISDVPPEVFDALPADGASEHDHYLYGAPKRSK